MEKKSKDIYVHTFDSEIYPRTLWVAITSEPLNDFTKRVQEEDGLIRDIPISTVPKNANGYTEAVYNEEQHLGGVLIRFPFKSCMTPHTMAHEAVHAANFIFDYSGVELDVKNDEAYAYFVGWIVKCCEKVKNYKNGGQV